MNKISVDIKEKIGKLIEDSIRKKLVHGMTLCEDEKHNLITSISEGLGKEFHCPHGSKRIASIVVYPPD